MRISDWSSDVCSSDLGFVKDSSQRGDPATYGALGLLWVPQAQALEVTAPGSIVRSSIQATLEAEVGTIVGGAAYERVRKRIDRSEEHTSELQSLMRISYAVFCLKKKKRQTIKQSNLRLHKTLLLYTSVTSTNSVQTL